MLINFNFLLNIYYEYIMDTKIVEVNKNIIISRSLNNESSFDVNINTVSFIPDGVIVKQIIYNPTVADPDAFIIYSNIISDNMAITYQNFPITYNNFYALKQSVNQNWNFNFITVQDGFGVSTPNPITGSLFIHLEFVKYKEVKEGKIY